MKIEKIAAFSNGLEGGNPAGVVISDTLPADTEMQAIAAEVNFSETVFAAPIENQTHTKVWRTRYFSPESEVSFCGHATIALGAALAQRYGANNYHLELNDNTITVRGDRDKSHYRASLTSPPTHSRPLTQAEVNAALDLFGYHPSQLDERLPPAHIEAGATHFFFALRSREDLAKMNYSLDRGRDFMRDQSLVTIMFVWLEAPGLFQVRNAFASGGVLEDPATGAAAAALMGYLRDLEFGLSEINLIQGEDMGARSLLTVHFNPSDAPHSGTPVTVSGLAHNLP